jgi:hypothetical protein
VQQQPQAAHAAQLPDLQPTQLQQLLLLLLLQALLLLPLQLLLQPRTQPPTDLPAGCSVLLLLLLLSLVNSAAALAQMLTAALAVEAVEHRMSYTYAAQHPHLQVMHSSVCCVATPHAQHVPRKGCHCCCCCCQHQRSTAQAGQESL